MNPRESKHRPHVMLPAAVLTGLLASLTHGCNQEQGIAPPLPVLKAGVTGAQHEKEVLTIELTGRTCPCLIAEVRPRVSGMVQKRRFAEGSLVEAGNVLYDIDPAPFKAALESAVANRAVAKNAADRARAAIGASEATLKQKQAVLQQAKSVREVQEILFKEKMASQVDRDRASEAEAVAAAAVEVAAAQIDSDRQAFAGAEAAIKQAEAAVETAKINLGYTSITAPISGRIGRSVVADGALVTAYQPTALATIQQLDPIYVDVRQSPGDLLRLRRRLGDGFTNRNGAGREKVKLILEDGTSYASEGTFEFQDVTVDPATGSVTLRAAFPNPNCLLMPGMLVHLRCIGESGAFAADGRVCSWTRWEKAG
jgi:membrane fusion protein, multidrug efflux system